MSSQQVAPPRSSANGFGRRKVDRETGARTESKTYSGKQVFANFGNAGLVNGGKVGGVGSHSHDRLIYVMAYLIGHHVEVHVKNGSVISGIFHGSNADKDFGVVLKMAHVVKDGSIKGQKSVADTVKKPQTMIIPARELVQVLAKDVSLSSDEFTNENGCEKRKDLLIDSAISHSQHVEAERELERWTPDEDAPECPELDNIFDGTWNRSWDQFETNETLFGVKSTFSEELYTTKLERGPQMRELEREAIRIAREIEGEETHDSHLAEERGIYYEEDFDLDEESKYSAVRRVAEDGSIEENEDSFSDARNTETFGSPLRSVMRMSSSDFSSKKVSEVQTSTTCSSVDEEVSSLVPSDKDVCISTSSDHDNQLTSDFAAKNSLSVDDETRLDEKLIKDHNGETDFLNGCSERIASEEAQASISQDIHPSNMKRLSSSSMVYGPSSSSQENKCSVSESSDFAKSGKLAAASETVNHSLRPGSSTSSTSEHVGAGSVSAGPGLSPSSSVGSLSLEKSTLNPNAKEFKLNPNAKSFTPSASVRPHVPASDGSFYYGSNMSAVPHMHGLPMGIGIGPTFGGPQPVVYNPQAAQLQSPQGYIHPNGPLYAQQMILGQPRPVYYMPTYQPEMPYKGRNF